MGRSGRARIWVTVVTEDGSVGTGTTGPGSSVGKYEPVHLFDGGERLHGFGVLIAVNNVNNIIAPKLRGIDVTCQQQIDKIMIQLDGTPNKARLGANAILSTSLAVRNAAARSVGLPLYRYVGGVNARTIPISASGNVNGCTRHGGPAPGKSAGDKPSFHWMIYGTKNYQEAMEVNVDLYHEFQNILLERYGIEASPQKVFISRGVVEDDREILDMWVDAFNNVGCKNKIGIYIDVAANGFWDEKRQRFIGLFSKEEKTKEDLIEFYKQLVSDYPMVLLEDPLDEDDYEGHALLTKELNVEIIGDDLYTTNLQRIQYGLELKATNGSLIKTRQAGTVSETLEVIELLQNHGMVACTLGEPEIAIGMNTGQGRIGMQQRVADIERELDDRARWPGKATFKF